MLLFYEPVRRVFGNTTTSLCNWQQLYGRQRLWRLRRVVCWMLSQLRVADTGHSHRHHHIVILAHLRRRRLQCHCHYHFLHIRLLDRRTQTDTALRMLYTNTSGHARQWVNKLNRPSHYGLRCAKNAHYDGIYICNRMRLCDRANFDTVVDVAKVFSFEL